MKVAVHLISLPWAPVFQPSIALGCLKAYIDLNFENRIRCFTYSAFIEVLINAFGEKLLDYAGPDNSGPWTESLSQLVYFDEFKKDSINKKHRNDYVKEIKKVKSTFSSSDVNMLRLSLKHYTKRQIVPNLKKDCLNIIGFSMNMQQSYFSAFLARHITENYSNIPAIFIFGGSSASAVEIVKFYSDEKIPGLMVIGEGESKLREIVEIAMKADTYDARLEDRIVSSINGTMRFSDRNLLFERNDQLYESQLKIDSLPDPDHSEYFDTLQRICKDSDIYDMFMERVAIALEGSRGCFANCDFCASNQVWTGFRKKKPMQIYDTAIEQSTKYECNKIHFVDTVCDPWASKFADELLRHKYRIPAFMELRAEHPEKFWTKLALCGAERLQIGAEALSPSLLLAMNKGTNVAQNILAQKYLKELKVESTSTLITNHPKSTVEDINYTKKVLSYIPHMDNYTLSEYFLISGSPLYNELSDTQRRSLKKAFIVRCKGLYRKHYLTEYFHYPENKRSIKMRKAWSKFICWFNERGKQLKETDNSLEIIECNNDMLWIRKVSTDSQEDYKYEDKYAKIYEICHKGSTIEGICKKLNCNKTGVIPILKEFVDEKLMLDIEGIFISLALRSKDILIKNFYKTN